MQYLPCATPPAAKINDFEVIRYKPGPAKSQVLKTDQGLGQFVLIEVGVSVILSKVLQYPLFDSLNLVLCLNVYCVLGQ